MILDAQEQRRSTRCSCLRTYLATRPLQIPSALSCSQLRGADWGLGASLKIRITHGKNVASLHPFHMHFRSSLFSEVDLLKSGQLVSLLPWQGKVSTALALMCGLFRALLFSSEPSDTCLDFTLGPVAVCLRVG